MTKSLKVSSVGMFNARRSVAFTLAEVLITLGIIGIVSAMTIPTLITKNQKMIIEKRITQDYSIINQAIRLQTVDGLDMSTESAGESTTYLKAWYDKYWAPYLKTAKVCINSKGCWQDLGETKALSGQNALYSSKGIGVGLSTISARLLNGTLINIDTWTGGRSVFGVTTTGNSIVAVYVDANGDSRPNTIGKDIYVFVWARETGLVPAGYSLTPAQIRANCSKNATGNWSGTYCLARVKLDGWKILDEVWDR